MKDSAPYTTPHHSLLLKYFVFSVLFLLWTSYGFSQNTKGDRPPKNNQRQIRETKVKSYKRKEKGSTRDIANRRLRTRGQSSANRANAKYPQPSPYSARKIKKEPERAAQPRGRVFSKSPRESKTRAWKGDVSGYPMKRMKPSGTDAARNNVYPQSGPYVRYARKRPKEKPPIYSKTIKGTAFVKHQPRAEERAWKGSADHGPIKNQSASGTIKNTYSQKGPYVAYYKKKQNRKEKAYSNRKEVSQVKRFSRSPKSQVNPSYGAPSASQPYVQGGRKNVYWGKYQKKERGVTTDITGGPLRTRNYRSQPVGLWGRDTLKFFGKKPFGDRSQRGAGGYPTATRKGQRGWKGDISGSPLRKTGRGPGEVPGKFVFPRKLSMSRQMKRNQALQGGGYKTRTRRGEQAQLNSIPNLVYANDLGSKKMKGIKSGKGGGSRRAGWNNNGQPIRGRGPGMGTIGAARYSGSFKQGRGYSESGIGYSGRIRRSDASGFFWEGMTHTGNIRRSSIRGFSRAGANYTGNQKRRAGFGTQGAGYSGNIRGKRGFGTQGADYSGNIKGKRGFGTQGADYAGNIKGKRGFGTQGADYSGNIKGKRGFGTQGADYSGNIKGKRGFGTQGADYSGNIKGRRGFGTQGADYSGNIKGRRGFGTQGANYSGNIERVGATKVFDENGVNYSGFIKRNRLNKEVKSNEINYSGYLKYKRAEKGGGSVSGKLMNNDFTAIATKPPASPDAGAIRYSGKIRRSRFVKYYVQNPNAAEASLKKRKPSPTTFSVQGLQVAVKEGDYSRKPNANKNAMPGIAPSHATVKASEYSRSMKQYWHYKHNPNSDREALKVIVPGKATARINDYQGNMKMHKYKDSRLHPDAQFAHGYRDNVKEERTVMMNVKLLWGRLFRKSETQPENLKEKNRRPRYDNKEKGLWND